MDGDSVRKTPPKYSVPASILELISEDVLEHLIIGFREKLKMGVTLYCRTGDGRLKRIDPEHDNPEGRQKYWAEVCKAYRSTPNCEKCCCDYDEQVLKDLLGNFGARENVKRCEQLGLIDMAAPIIVQGTTLGVVIAGQRILRGSEHVDYIESRIKAQCPDRVSTLTDALLLDINDKPTGDFSPLCSEEDLRRCLGDLQSFADLIAQICAPVAEQRWKIARDDFLDYWINESCERIPTNIVEWGRQIQRCLGSFVDFAHPLVERVGMFHGESSNSDDSFVLLSLVAMNSPKWWQSSPFPLAVDSFSKSTTYYSPGTMPAPMAEGVGERLARAKWFYLVPFSHPVPARSGEVFSLAVVQCKDILDPEDEIYCRRFLSDLCRRDARMRLHIRQIDLVEDFRRHVVEKRHDIKTSMTHLVVFSQRLMRWLVEGYDPKGSEVQETYRSFQKSMADNTTIVSSLQAPTGIRKPPKLESLNLFETIREQIGLFASTAGEKNIKIEERGFPAENAYVLCERPDLFRAIAALLDNAIKYSYRDGRSVIVSAERLSDDEASFAIENYGIGIPQERLSNIKKRTERALVLDRNVRRHGTGIGLAIATHVFVELLGGTLHIDSFRAPGVTGETEEYHRYTTRVLVRLPIQKEK